MLCEFELPSNPQIRIRLREATVAEAMDFSAIDPHCEEEAATHFLETVQDSQNKSDPRKWTAEDRRYALFLYYLYTTTDKNISLAYHCSVCNKEHVQDILLDDILKSYTPINGANFRDFVHEGHNIVVRPLNGNDMENLEKYRFDLELTEARVDYHTLSPTEIKRLETEIRTKRMRMSMYRAICCVDMPYLNENGTPESRRSAVAEILQKMTIREFKAFFEKVEKALADMRHGLRSIYRDGRIFLEIPNVKQDEHPDLQEVTLHYPFRFGAVIPSI